MKTPTQDVLHLRSINSAEVSLFLIRGYTFGLRVVPTRTNIQSKASLCYYAAVYDLILYTSKMTFQRIGVECCKRFNAKARYFSDGLQIATTYVGKTVVMNILLA